MISEGELHAAIAECMGQREPNANTCMKLASYYTILDHIRPSYSNAVEPTGQVEYNSGSEFSAAVRGQDVKKVLEIMDELMDALMVLSPKLYNATMDKIYDM